MKKLFFLIIVIIISSCTEDKPKEVINQDSLDKAEKAYNDSVRAYNIAYEKYFEKYKKTKRYKDSMKIVEKENKRREKEALILDQTNNPMKYLSLKKFNWSKGGFGSVAIVSFIFKNESQKTAYDITVRMNFKGESGTELSSEERLITISIPPGKTKTASKINYGFINDMTEKASAEIIDANFK